MGAKLKAPAEGWWASTTKWQPFGPLADKMEVWGTTFPSFYILWRAHGLRPPNRGPSGPLAGKIELWGTMLPPSSSFWGLMAFVHIIWDLFVWFALVVFFCFIHHGTPKGSFPECFVKIRLDLAEVFRI